MKIRALLIGAAAAALLAAAPGFSASTSPGKNSAYESVGFAGPLPAYPPATPILTATILKGKAKRVLEIATMLTVTPSAPVTPVTAIRVNGVTVEPGPGWNTAQDCSGVNAVGCTLNGLHWLDLDAAELANPGLFIGQPLVVEFFGSDYLASNPAYSASLAVRMEKK